MGETFNHNGEKIVDQDYKGKQYSSASVIRCELIRTSMVNTVITENGIFAHNLWDSCSFYGANFRRPEFDKDSFHECVMAETDFNHIILESVQMEACKCQGGYWSQAYINNTHFNNVLFRQTVLSDSEIYQSVFKDCDFDKGGFSGGWLTDVTFCNAKYWKTGFSGTKLNLCHFESCNFKEDKMKGSIMKDTELEKCVIETETFSDLIGCKFSECENKNITFGQMDRCSFKFCTFENITFGQMDQCSFEDCAFKNVIFKQIDRCGFEDCTFENAEMNWDDMKSVTFNRLEMLGGAALKIDFKEMNLKRPGIFHNVNMPECDFSSLSLNGWEFQECRLTGSNFSKTYILKADFSGAQLGSDSGSTTKTTSFSGAYLGKVDFQNSKMYGVNLADCFTDENSMVNFSAADAQSARFVNTFLYNCVFTHINAKGADFSSAILISDDFTKGQMDGVDRGIETNFTGTFLAGCKFSEASMNFVTLTNGMIAMHGGFLFHLSDSLWGELKDENDPKKEGVRAEFKKNIKELDQNDCFLNIETMPNTGWKVTNGKQVLYYIDRQVEGSIGVYRTMGIFLFETVEREKINDWIPQLNNKIIPDGLLSELHDRKIDVRGTVTVKQKNEQWEITDNELGNSGFYNYSIIYEVDVLRVYARHIRILHPDRTGHIVCKDIAFDTTGIYPAQFGRNTCCPNGQYFENPSDSEAWKKMLRTDNFSWPQSSRCDTHL